MMLYQNQAELAWAAKLSASAYAVRDYLSLAANREGLCFPSTRVIAMATRMEQRTVFRSLIELEKAGIVRRVGRHGKATLYEVVPPDFEEDHVCQSRQGGMTDSSGVSDEIVIPLTIRTEVDPPKKNQQQQGQRPVVAAGISDLSSPQQRPGTARSETYRALSDVGITGAWRDRLSATALSPAAVRDTWRTWRARSRNTGLFVEMLKSKANECDAIANKRLVERPGPAY